MKYDMIFFHPGGLNPEGLQGPYFPVGCIGLASYLKKEQINVKIVNLMLEQILNPDKDISGIIREYPAHCYGIDLHWFVHSFESMELARICREIYPDSRIIIGGLTASLFEKEILSSFPHIDAVIRGDAEEPLRQYLSFVLHKTPSVDTIPNLSYRGKNGEIIRNKAQFNITGEALDALDFMDFSLVMNFEKHFYLVNLDYVPIPSIKRTARLQEYYNPAIPLKPWFLYTGRGCNHACSFCGGARSAYQQAFHRPLILRSPARIARDLKQYDKLGIDILYIPHSPLITDSGFHAEIFACLQERLSYGFLFEDTPFNIDLEIMDRYLTFFNPQKSIIRLYLSSIGSRTALLNNFPSNLDAVVALIRFLKNRIYIMVGILIGLPTQNLADTYAMAEYAKQLKAAGAIVVVYNAELHPGSELFTRPQKYGIELELNTFMDYYDFLKHKKDKTMTSGYRTANDVDIRTQRAILEKALE